MKKKLLILGVVLVALLFLGFNVFASTEIFVNDLSFTYGENTLIYDFGSQVFWLNSAILFNCGAGIPNGVFTEQIGQMSCDTPVIWQVTVTGEIVGTPPIEESGIADVVLSGFYLGGGGGTGIFAISNTFVQNSLAYIGEAVTGLGPLLYVVVGLPIAFWVVRKVISLIPKK